MSTLCITASRLGLPDILGNESTSGVRKNISGKLSKPSDHFGNNKVINKALCEITQAGWSAVQIQLARSALNKMAQVNTALGRTDGVESILAQIITEQCKSTDQRCELAKNKVADIFEKLHSQNLKQQQEIQKRIDAEKTSGLWSKLVNFFKGLAGLLSAASSIVTGPAGIAAATLLVASIVTAYVLPSDQGKWISFGLGVAGALCGGLGGVFNLAKTTTHGTLKLAGNLAQLGSGVSSGIAAGAGMVRSYYDSKSLNAQSALIEIKALETKLTTDAEDEREELKLIIEAQDRGIKAAIKGLDEHSRIGLLAAQERSES